MNWINEFVARGVEVVNPMAKTPVDAKPTFRTSDAVTAENDVTVTVPPIFGRAPAAAAASRTMLFWVVKTEKVPAGCAGPIDH